MKVLLIDISNGDSILAFRKTFLSIINVAIKRQLDTDIKIILDAETTPPYKLTKYHDSAEALIELSSYELKEVHTKINFSILDLNQAYHYTSNYRYPVVTIGVGAELTDSFILDAITSHDEGINRIANKYLSKSEEVMDKSALNGSLIFTEQTLEAKRRQMEIDALMYTDKAAEAKLHGEDI